MEAWARLYASRPKGKGLLILELTVMTTKKCQCRTHDLSLFVEYLDCLHFAKLHEINPCWLLRISYCASHRSTVQLVRFPTRQQKNLLLMSRHTVPSLTCRTLLGYKTETLLSPYWIHLNTSIHRHKGWGAWSWTFSLTLAGMCKAEMQRRCCKKEGFAWVPLNFRLKMSYGGRFSPWYIHLKFVASNWHRAHV